MFLFFLIIFLFWSINHIKHYIDLANNPDIRKKDKSYKGIIRQNYCPKKSSKIEPKERVFYTIRNGEIIDAIRNFIKIEISPEYRVYILAQLIVKSSVHSNTCGLFNGFYKKDGVGHYGGKNSNDLNRICKDIVLDYPIFSKNSCNINFWVKNIMETEKKYLKMEKKYLKKDKNFLKMVKKYNAKKL